MKSREEVEALKQDWLSEPCYNLNGIEGFEAYNKELEDFQAHWEQIWEEKENERQLAIDKKANKLGIEGIYRLVLKNQELTKRIEKACYSICDGETYNAYRILNGWETD